jgi:hypothetical protein
MLSLHDDVITLVFSSHYLQSRRQLPDNIHEGDHGEITVHILRSHWVLGDKYYTRREGRRKKEKELLGEFGEGETREFVGDMKSLRN